VNGYLVFVLDRHIVAQPFDPVSLAAAGEPLQVADAGFHTGQTGANFSVANAGIIAIARAPEASSGVTWYTRGGERTTVNEAGNFSNPELSPNDRLAAVLRAVSGTEDILTLDAGSGAARLFASGASGRVTTPIWSPTGLSLRFSRVSATTVDTFEKPIEGGSERPFDYPQDLTSRGSFYPVRSPPAARWSCSRSATATATS
jgi:hypothetical protein